MLTALHLRLNHPSPYQLKTVVKRYLYALDMDKAVDRVSAACHPCAALRQTPSARIQQSTSLQPAAIGTSFANDKLLQQHRITIELGHANNLNRNSVAKRAIQELESELLHQDPSGGAVSSLTLAVATATLNSRIRSRGLSAREMWTQREQFSNTQVSLDDETLIQTQHEQRLTNHPHSEKSKAPLAQRRPTPSIEVGDIVYLHSDRNKTRTRDRYLVFAVELPFCNIRKFTGTQLRRASYRVKLSECLKVPPDVSTHPPYPANDSETEDDLIPAPPPPPPDIPAAISVPPEPGPQQQSALQDTSTTPPDQGCCRLLRSRRPRAHLRDYVTDL